MTPDISCSLHLFPLYRIFNQLMNIKAYAKINIGLRILRKRADGFHDLETVFHRVDITDDILLEPCRSIELHCDSTAVPSDDSNLCLRAARLVMDMFHPLRGASITLTKRIPVGAGLGGGSSDAASTLIGLNKFWNLNLSDENLHTLALTLGSDVPYFMKPGSAVATGRGENLKYFALDVPYVILVVHPGIHVSTAWAYQQVHRSEDAPAGNVLNDVRSNIQRPELLRKLVVNDFEDPVFRHHPEIAQVKTNLLNAGAIFAQMSGSGSSVYGFFIDPQSAHQASVTLQKRYRVFTTPAHFQPQDVV